MKTKCKMKFEVAEAAGMSMRTFSRWLQPRLEQLQKFGVTPYTKLLPPRAVKYICYELGIHEEDF